MTTDRIHAYPFENLVQLIVAGDDNAATRMLESSPQLAQERAERGGAEKAVVDPDGGMGCNRPIRHFRRTPISHRTAISCIEPCAEVAA